MDPIQPQTQEAQAKKSYGPLIGIIVIVILLVIAALYFWGEKISTTESEVTLPPATSQNSSASNADDLESIEAELDAGASTDVDLSDLNTI